MDREQLGRIAYTAYVDYIGEGEEMDTWEQLPESDRKIYRYIGEAVWRHGLHTIKELVRGAKPGDLVDMEGFYIIKPLDK